jgi:hypothetical protein
LLGNILFGLISKIAKKEENSPRITGMLLDFEVFEFDDYVNMLEN